MLVGSKSKSILPDSLDKPFHVHFWIHFNSSRAIDDERWKLIYELNIAKDYRVSPFVGAVSDGRVLFFVCLNFNFPHNSTFSPSESVYETVK